MFVSDFYAKNKIQESISPIDLAELLYNSLDKKYPEAVRRYGHEVVGDMIMDYAEDAQSIRSMSDIDIAVDEIMDDLANFRGDKTNELPADNEPTKLPANINDDDWYVIDDQGGIVSSHSPSAYRPPFGTRIIELENGQRAMRGLTMKIEAPKGLARKNTQPNTEPPLKENLRKWFKEKWVRFGPDGKIRGACARGDDSEGKPKCLPQAKAHALGKKGRKYAASKKRREDPDPKRSGKAINVATKKKSNEDVSEAREGPMREILRKMLPGWPDYVIKDWISSRVKNEQDLKDLKGWLGELNKQVVPNSWKLHQKMQLTFDMLSPKTRYFMKTKRQFGARNPFMIPRDEERSADAEQLIKSKGMDNLPPVIMLQHANGLELCEGWHRTMAAFRLNPNGFLVNAWIGQSAEQGVAEAFGPLPKDNQQIRLGRHTVDIERVGLDKNYISFAWHDSKGQEHYEEVAVGDLGSYDDLIKKIKQEISYQERRYTEQGVAEGSQQTQFTDEELDAINQYLDDDLSFQALKTYPGLIRKIAAHLDITSIRGHSGEMNFYDRLVQAREEGDIPQQGVAEGSDIPQWRVEQSDATGRYYVVSGYSDKSRKVWKSKLGAIDFVKKADAEAKAQELNQGVAEAAGLYGPFTVTINTGERPQSRTKTKKFRREDDAILWAQDWLEDFPQYSFATAEVTDPEGNVVWTTDEQGVVEAVDTKSLDSATVRRIQNYLNKEFDANLDVDGELGPLTLKSIKKYIPASRKKPAPDPQRTTAVQGNELKEQQLDEKCWPGYKKKGMKTMFGKRYPNCVKNNKSNEDIEENKRIPRKPGQPADSKKHSDLYTDENPKGTIHGLKFATAEDARASVSKIRNSGRSHAHKIQAAVAMEQRAKAAGKTEAAGVYRKFINSIKKTNEDQQTCPECGGPMFSSLLINEKKDACYYKVKSRYKVWPSAYASGALVQCRKKGAGNWGSKTNETRFYFTVKATLAESLRDDFAMTQDRDGWYISEDQGPAKILEAQRAFGVPKIKEVKLKEVRISDYTGRAGTIGDDNTASPIGSIAKRGKKHA